MKKRSYKHLTESEKYQIKALYESGMSGAAIGRQLGRCGSTIRREIKRGWLDRYGCYSVKRSQRLKARSRRCSGISRRTLVGETWRLVRRALKARLSPEQIAGRYRLVTGKSLSHTTIYRRLWSDEDSIAIKYYLRHRGKKYRYGKAGKSLIPNRVDISNRPSLVEKKERLGDWEADTVWGKNNSGALVTLVDRASKFTLIGKVKRKTADEVSNTIITLLKNYKNKTHTITYDNGSEFARHEEVNHCLLSQSFFATPYHSWERGLNEHTNGLIRQWWPKDTYFTHITQTQCQIIQNYLNNRPRKCLNYLTPHEAFFNTTPVQIIR